jgi:ABC-2 type transport system permease protein
MAVLIVGATLIASVSGFATYYASQSQGLPLDAQRVEVASLMLVPMAVVFAAVGSLLAAWNPRAAVGLLGGVAFLSFLDSEVGPILRFPGWVQDLSPFKLFGTPLLTGLDGRNLALLLLLACAGVGSSILLMQRRDIGA